MGEVTSPNTVTWIIVALTAVTTLKGVSDGILAWLTKRDQLRFDYSRLEEKAAESQKVALQTTTLVKEVQTELERCQEQHTSSGIDREALRNENAVLRNELQRVLEDVKELKQQSRELREQARLCSNCSADVMGPPPKK